MGASKWAFLVVWVAAPAALGMLSWWFRQELVDLLGINPRRMADSLGRSVGFLRDVSVNVLANLIAAAVIYLFATLAGLLPPRWDLVAVSLMLITLFVTATLGVAARFASGRFAPIFGGLFCIFSGISISVATFFFEDSLWRSVLGSMSAWIFFAASIFFFRIRSVIYGRRPDSVD
ncbi:hypothetical protein [Solwaraspora sp. WMMA2101]|uniref:hypothetical protein n=1 Tax=Solwaraspora sp. WMMA2101 TaxID=3404124 RepID=UPI003B9420EA